MAGIKEIEITSVGRAGEIDFSRSEGRAYYTSNKVYDSADKLYQEFEQLYHQAMSLETGGRRRSVLRAVCTFETAMEMSQLHPECVEVIVPLREINPEQNHCLIMLAKNVHPSPVPEWPSVYEYWRHPNGRGKTPLNRVQSIQDEFFLANYLTQSDIEHLLEIWQPFGWTREGVRGFIHSHPGIWFSGVRSRETGELVSACMGEGLEFGGVHLVEGTEYGTRPGFEGRGLCTAVVTALHAQILQDTFYKTGGMPIITAEFNMTSRSDIVGRHVGMTIPFVEGNQMLTNSPIQVLRHNVSVLDREPPNTIRLQELGQQADHFRDAYGTTYPFWRNFIFGVLSQASIQSYYSRLQVQEILSLIHS